MEEICNKPYIDENFENQEQMCLHFKEYCQNQIDGQTFINWYYCGMFNYSLILVFIFMVPFLIQIFYMLSQTAEQYLSPTVTYISKKINMSQTLAGVTLVAIGNGSCDVMTAILAGNSEDNVGYTVGSIFGAGLFVTTVSLARVLYKSPKDIIQPNKAMVARDLLFFFISISMILLFGYIGHINIYMASTFLSLYFVYILVTLKQEDNIKQQQKKLENDMLLSFEMNEDVIQPHQSTQIFFENDNNLQKKQSEDSILQDNQFQQIQENLISSDDYEEISFQSINTIINKDNQEKSFQAKQNISLEKVLDKNHYDNSTQQDKKSTLSTQASLSILQDQNQSILDVKQSSKTKLILNLQKIKQFVKQQAKQQEEQKRWKDLNILEKIIYIWQFLTDMLLKITIPQSQENWSKTLAIITCTLSPLFLFGSNTLLPQSLVNIWGNQWYIAVTIIFVGLLSSLLVWKLTHRSKAPQNMYFFTVLTFLNSIAWIALLVNILVEFLQFLQFLTGINKVYLGMTFLALGNSAGDFFTNGQLSKTGYAQMAFTGCYAGQIFNLLIGFGLSLVINTWNNDIKFDLFGQKYSHKTNYIEVHMGYLLVIMALLNITIMIIYSVVSKFQYGKAIGHWLCFYYCLIFIGATVGGFYAFFNNL